MVFQLRWRAAARSRSSTMLTRGVLICRSLVTSCKPARVDGAARGQHPDRDRPASGPSCTAVKRHGDRRRGMSIDAPGSRAPGPHPRAGRRSIVRTAVTDSRRASAPDSERVAEARTRAQERLHRQRGTLRPLGWGVLLAVVLGSANSHPVPGPHGKALAVTLALCVFAVTLLVAVRDGFPERSVELQTAVIAVMGAAGVAIAGLQLKGATEVAAGVAVFMAITRLPFNAGVAIGGAVTVALGTVTAAAGSSSSAVAAGTLVTVLVGVIAQFLKQSRESQ